MAQWAENPGFFKSFAGQKMIFRNKPLLLLLAETCNVGILR